MIAPTDRALRKALAFRQCEQCGYDLVTGEGERACHYYECPGLPEELDTRCPTCLYDFGVGDGQPGCTDPPSCRFAREVAPQRVAALQRWVALQAG